MQKKTYNNCLAGDHTFIKSRPDCQICGASPGGGPVKGKNVEILSAPKHKGNTPLPNTNN